jgi:hypothetical protein
MRRSLLAAVLAVAGVVALHESAAGLMIAMRPAPQRAATAEVVVVGKVTAIEKDTVDAPRFKGDKEKVAYTVAVVKIENAFAGANNLTHIKVGFIPPPRGHQEPPANARPQRTGFQPVYLKEGTEGLFYLSKHHSGQFYIIHPIMSPAEPKMEGYKDEVALAKRACAVLADPQKSLKADKAADRGFAAALLVRKYRTYPEGAGGGEYVNGKLGADESRLILKALAEANWKADPATGNSEAYTAFAQLGLTDMDGWKYPVAKPGEDFQEKTKEAFVKWLEGPGKDYRVNKWLPKKK